ncbi:hypothetical protein GGI16_000690 [Coemansia sp. S142-1]|nr:hypothetical protein GGI16_000690 [Coemansia sp. S142-1]
MQAQPPTAVPPDEIQEGMAPPVNTTHPTSTTALIEATPANQTLPAAALTQAPGRAHAAAPWTSSQTPFTYSAIATQGHINAGSSIPRSIQAKRALVNKRPKTMFSGLELISGGVLNADEPPVKIMANVPFTGHFCTYAIPTDVSPDEFAEAVDDACRTEQMNGITWPHFQISPSQGVAGIGVRNAEELAILKEAQILVRGKPLAPKRVAAFKDSHAYILITQMAVDSFETKAKDIAAALSPYGDIVDIIFERCGQAVYNHAKVILDKKPDMSIPSRLQIGPNLAILSGKKVEYYCNYCRQAGHFKDKCPVRPGNKKHAASEDETPIIAESNNNVHDSLPIRNSNKGTAKSGTKSNPNKSRDSSTKSGKAALPSFGNKRPRNDQGPGTHPVPAQSPKPNPTVTTSEHASQTFVTGASNFGPIKPVKSSKHSGRSTSISVSGLVAAQSAHNMGNPASAPSSAQTGKYPTALPITENEAVETATNSCENQSHVAVSISEPSHAAAFSDPNAMTCNSNEPVPEASANPPPAHQTQTTTAKAIAIVEKDVEGKERISIFEQRLSGSGTPQ